jgi:anti-anti-sigma factor
MTPEVAVERRADGTVVICVAGELTWNDAHALSVLCADAHSEQRATRLVLDLERVPFLDSAGLSAVFACIQSANRLGIPFRIRANTSVARTLSIYAIDGVSVSDS